MDLSESAPLTYNEVIERYSIELLKAPGDLVIRNHDIAVTKTGDLMLNDEVYSAMYRLVQTWRFTAPSLTILFALFDAARQREKDSVAELSNLRPLAGSPFFGRAQIEKYHEANDKVGAAQLALQSYAGPIVLVLNGLLLALRDDLQCSQQDWRSAGPIIGGYSIGAFLEAAANNFRHEDEWTKTRAPNHRQLASIRVLEAAFGKKFRDISGSRHSPNIAPEALELLADGDAENVSRKFFAFANDLATRANATAPNEIHK
jgi:hypothetical protein